MKEGAIAVAVGAEEPVSRTAPRNRRKSRLLLMLSVPLLLAAIGLYLWLG